MSSIANATPFLSASELCFAYGKSRVIDKVSVDVSPGEMLGIIGPNASGKTSLLKLLAGLHSAESGRVQLNGIPLLQLPLNERARKIGYLAQHVHSCWPLPARAVVELGRLPHRSQKEDISGCDQLAVTAALQQCELTELSERGIHQLSGGERARVMLARMLATEAPLLIADEPVASLDLYHQLKVMGIFQDHCRRGGSVVIVLHDLNLASRFCQRLLLLHKGQTAASGHAHDVLRSARLAEVYGVDIDVQSSANGAELSLSARQKLVDWRD